MPQGYKPDPSKLPNPEKRRIILALSSDEIESIKYDSDYRRTLDSFKKSGKVWLMDNSIESYEDRDTIVFLEKLRDENLLDGGNILIQSCDNNSVYFLAQQVKNKERQKWDHYTTICNYLGAKNISIEVTDIKNFAAENDLQSQISNLWFGLIGDKKFAKEKKEELNKVIKASFDGSSPSIKKAENYVKEHSLESDQDIYFLINNLKSTNSGFQFESEINLFSQVEDRINVLGGLYIPQQFTQIKASFRHLFKENRKYIVKIKLQFPSNKQID